MADLSIDQQNFKPSRRFTKRMLVANNVGAWLSIGGAIYVGEGVSNVVVPSMAMLLVALFSAYAGIGHLDYRTAADQQQRP